jgi:hypothetical protein
MDKLKSSFIHPSIHSFIIYQISPPLMASSVAAADNHGRKSRKWCKIPFSTFPLPTPHLPYPFPSQLAAANWTWWKSSSLFWIGNEIG